MKGKHIYSIVLCFISIVGFTVISSAQRCDKKEFCKDTDYGDYDYKSQTHFAKLSPGDTATINIVAYSGNDMRILVCFDPELGDSKYQVVESTREVKRIMKLGPERTEPKYKLDKDGNEVTDPETGEKIQDGEVKVRDTIYETKTNINDKLLFNSTQAKDKTYYEEKNIAKTKRLKIKIQIPKGADEDMIGCVNILVGKKTAKSNKFYKGQD